MELGLDVIAQVVTQLLDSLGSTVVSVEVIVFGRSRASFRSNFA
jgi:hypothetical protein